MSLSRLRPYFWFLLRRLLLTLLTLLGLATIVFVMVKLIPGDEAQIVAGPEASAAQIQLVRERLGLDSPIYVQYLRFVGRLLQGDLGTSLSTFQPVLSDLQKVLPSTIELVLLAMVMNLTVAIPVATIAAARRNGSFDTGARIAAVVLAGMPAFWLALILQYLLGSVWNIFPISGHNSFGMVMPVRTGMTSVDALLAGNLPAFFDALRYLVLPGVSLAVLFSTQIFRALRTSLLGTLQSEFISVARAKGVRPWRLLLRHALPNALSPTITLAGTQIGSMIGGSVMVEIIFARRGIGSYIANAVLLKDTHAVLGAVIFIGTIVCIASFAVDLLQVLLDPRIRATQLEGATR